MKNLIFIVFTVFLTGCSTTPKGETYFLKAISQLEKGDTLSAIQNLKDAIASDSTIWEAYQNLGSLYYHQHDTTASIENYCSALTLSDSNTFVGRALIDAYREFSMLDKSMELTCRMIDKYPDSVYFHLQRAKVNILLEDYQNMDADLQTYLNVYPNDVDGVQSAAWLYSNSAMYDNAIKCYDKALEVDSLAGSGKIDRYNAYYNLGICLYYAQQNERALETFGKIPTDNPLYINALRYRGQINSEMGRYTQAKEDLRAIIKLDPDDTLAKSALKSIEDYQNIPAYTIVNPKEANSSKVKLVLAQSKNGKYGYLRYNHDSKKYDIVAIPFKYENAFPDVVSAKSEFTGLIAVSNGSKWAVIGKNLTEITPFKYDYVWIDSKNRNSHYAMVNIGGKSDSQGNVTGGKYGVVSQSGEAGAVRYDAIGFEEFDIFGKDYQRIPVRLGEKCGYINIYGDVVIPIKYDDVSYFSGNWRSVVSLDGYLYSIDKQGNQQPFTSAEAVAASVGGYSMSWVFYEHQ